MTSAKIELRDDVSQSALPNPVQKSLVKKQRPILAAPVLSDSKPGTSEGSAQQISLRKPPPSQELALTAEDQAQLAAQQLEDKQANISQMEAMILSLQESGAPAGDIEHFSQLKMAIEDQSIEEPQASEANTPELTEDEIKNDFAASLEEAGIPPEKLDRMLEAFSPPPESIPDNTDIEPLPPHKQ